MGGNLKRIPQREVLDGDTESPEAVVESLGTCGGQPVVRGGVRTTTGLLRRWQRLSVADLSRAQ